MGTFYTVLRNTPYSHSAPELLTLSTPDLYRHSRYNASEVHLSFQLIPRLCTAYYCGSSCLYYSGPVNCLLTQAQYSVDHLRSTSCRYGAPE